MSGKVISKLENTAILMSICIQSYWTNAINKIASKEGGWMGLLRVSLLVIPMAVVLYPEIGISAIENINGMAALSQKVQNEIQSHGISIVLNAAGIGTAAFALITSRWTMLLFGAAYLVFVNVFFGFVNGAFKV
ncbi:hypothetical protein EDM53_01610 [Rickettsiales endosymbiont of Peranema trichophorum]|uniref:hypothetical protein n=1 Tax=Rickettsiales endosymbiont of Peranema trichophorum TaxID=2486577 RepID=UPI001022DBCF|nr:hypothetical protein [Rickettsiales endosymbiont of Peranema trichophorum]RZI47505.1 hypothetical protein EDM53_01610 [Rickettsiales endosymbiont of Peranema trichophorum]